MGMFNVSIFVVYVEDQRARTKRVIVKALFAIGSRNDSLPHTNLRPTIGPWARDWILHALLSRISITSKRTTPHNSLDENIRSGQGMPTSRQPLLTTNIASKHSHGRTSRSSNIPMRGNCLRTSLSKESRHTVRKTSQSPSIARAVNILLAAKGESAASFLLMGQQTPSFL